MSSLGSHINQCPPGPHQHQHPFIIQHPGFNPLCFQIRIIHLIPDFGRQFFKFAVLRSNRVFISHYASGNEWFKLRQIPFWVAFKTRPGNGFPIVQSGTIGDVSIWVLRTSRICNEIANPFIRESIAVAHFVGHGRQFSKRVHAGFQIAFADERPVNSGGSKFE